MDSDIFLLKHSFTGDRIGQYFTNEKV